MTVASPDWNRLDRIWRSQPSPSIHRTDLSAALRRRRTATALVVAGEVGITLGMVAFTVRWFRHSDMFPSWSVAGFWIVWLVATLFGWWNRRGQWSVDVASLEEFARLSLDRAERKLRVVWFSAGLTVVQLTLLFFAGRSVGFDSTFTVVAAATVSGVAAWGWWYRRGALREIDHFAAVLEADSKLG